MPSFASIERAYEAAREREHTDLPDLTRDEIDEWEERQHAYENKPPTSVESKVLALVTANPGILYRDVLAHFETDQEFGYINQEGVWTPWGIIAANALGRLNSGLKLLRIEQVPTGYGGLVDNTYFVK